MPAKPLNEKTKKALRDKAEGTRFTYGELAQVYRRGQGAYLSSGSVTSLWRLGLWVGSTATCRAKEALVRPTPTSIGKLGVKSDGSFR